MTQPNIFGLGEAQHTARMLAASLSQSVELCTSATQADILLIPGEPGWDELAAEHIAMADRRIVILDPAPLADDAHQRLQTAVTDGGAQIYFSESLAGNPIVRHFRECLPEILSACAVEAAYAQDQATGITRIFRLLRALGLPVTHIVDSQGNTGARLITAGAGDLTIRIAMAGSAKKTTTATLYGAKGIASIELPPGNDARPAQTTIVTSEGERRLPTIYENPDRALLRAIHSGDAATASLGDFAADCALMREVLA